MTKRNVSIATCRMRCVHRDKKQRDSARDLCIFREWWKDFMTQSRCLQLTMSVVARARLAQSFHGEDRVQVFESSVGAWWSSCWKPTLQRSGERKQKMVWSSVEHTQHSGKFAEWSLNIRKICYLRSDVISGSIYMGTANGMIGELHCVRSKWWICTSRIQATCNLDSQPAMKRLVKQEEKKQSTSCYRGMFPIVISMVAVALLARLRHRRTQMDMFVQEGPQRACLTENRLHVVQELV